MVRVLVRSVGRSIHRSSVVSRVDRRTERAEHLASETATWTVSTKTDSVLLVHPTRCVDAGFGVAEPGDQGEELIGASLKNRVEILVWVAL